ncbi:tight junction protein ZO-3 isoform X2 [Cyprinodon tularosa]|uniref:tight junction protein ZO-3 isoform X2 n=1 Tax=Cyprinodon tularosa TaxID=77115 RepID=UPI0018E221A1|nr:tight junction protein ZO-3 isoform X2 [Cyprinodon tularosa]
MAGGHRCFAQKPGMDEITIWEQHTITLNKDPKVGFGFALSGGKDKPNPDTGETAVVVSDVLPNGPAMGRLFNKDQIVMVNGVSMENVHSNYTIHTLKACGKTANITVKRPRKIQIPATSRPTRAASQSNLLDQDPPRRTRRYSDGSDNRDAGRYNPRGRSPSPQRNGYGATLPLMSGYKRLPQNNAPEKPIKTTLIKKKITDEYGLKLGSQIFIKHMTESGLAAKEGTLQEGDLILKINGMTTENLSLLETKHLVEKSRGKLTMTVLRDDRKFLVTIPEVDDSPPNSDEERRKDSSSELEDISDIDEDITPRRATRQHTREKRTRRTRAEPPPRAKSRDPSPVRSTLSRPPPRSYASRRAPSESDSDRSATPPPPVRRVSPDMKDSSKYRALPGLSTLPNPRSSPVNNWSLPRPSSASSRPRKPVSDSDSDRSASPPPRRESPLPDARYKSLSDLPPASLRSSPIHIRDEPPRRVNSPVRIPPRDSDSESDSTSAPPPRHSTSYSQDSLSRYRVLPEVSLQPHVEPPRWSETSEQPQKADSEQESEASYASPPRRDTSGSGNSNRANSRRRVLSKKATSVPSKQDPPRQVKSPTRPPPDESSESDELSHLRRSGSSEGEDQRRSVPRGANGGGAIRSGISVKNNPQLYSKPVEEPLYFLPPDSYPSSNPGYSSDVNTVRFVKGRSLGLRLVGGNDVGIFVGGVQPNSPAYEEGMKEGDQILKVNNIDFGHFTREEAANFLLNLPAGERVEICTQKKMDIYKKIIKSSLGDNFYIRTHFDYETEEPRGLNFTRGEVFRVLDTMYKGKIGNWLAVRMGNDLHEMDKGIIPNQEKAEKLATIERSQRSTGERQGTGPRAEFWKLRGLRGNKKNEKNNRRSREDLLQLTIQGKFPAYEKVLLREANFKRPIVILGPLNDIAMEKLVHEMPDEYEIAEMVPRSGGGDSSSTVIKLDTVRRIAEKDKHPLLDITPTAVERLNYIQYHPMVLFLDPHSRKDVKTMRQRYNPDSNKSSRRLYSQAVKMKKHANHLFSACIELQPGTHKWYDTLKDSIRHQQSKPVWVSEVTLESGGEQDLDALDPTQMDYLSAASDLEDTDGEAITDGEAYTDNEDLEEAYPGQNVARFPQSSRNQGAALARSSEPALEYETPPVEREPSDDGYSDREIPPLMHVPEPRSTQQHDYSPPRSPAAEEETSHRSFSDSDFDALDVDQPSDGPPDFVAPDPLNRHSINRPSYEEEAPESPQPAPLSAIEERLEQTRMAEPQAQAEGKKGPAFIVLAHHHQAVQYRRTQIQGSDSSDDDEFDDDDVVDDVEWGPATEL